MTDTQTTIFHGIVLAINQGATIAWASWRPRGYDHSSDEWNTWLVHSCPLCANAHSIVCHYDAVRGNEVIATITAPCDRSKTIVLANRAVKSMMSRWFNEVNREPISRETKEAVIAKTDGRCWYCGFDMKTRGGEFYGCIDHVFPIALGGSNDQTNMVPACRDCNSKKRDKTVEHFRASRGGGAFWGEPV